MHPASLLSISQRESREGWIASCPALLSKGLHQQENRQNPKQLEELAGGARKALGSLLRRLHSLAQDQQQDHAVLGRRRGMELRTGIALLRIAEAAPPAIDLSTIWN